MDQIPNPINEDKVSIFLIINADKFEYFRKIQLIFDIYTKIEKFIFISDLENFIFFPDQCYKDQNPNLFSTIQDIDNNFINQLNDESRSLLLIRNKLFINNNEQITEILEIQRKNIAIVVLDLSVAKKLKSSLLQYQIIFLIKKKSITFFKKCKELLIPFLDAFNFNQVESYNFKFDPNIQFMLSKKNFTMELPFPDSSANEASDFDYDNLRKFLVPGLYDESLRCKNCNAILLNSKNKENCCNKIPNIIDHMVTFDEPPQYLKEMLHEFADKPNMIRLINRCCRPRIQRASINYLADRYSTLFLNGIPYAVDSRFQFLEPAYLIFNNLDHVLDNWRFNHEDYINILSICKEFIRNNDVIKNYMLESLEKLGGNEKYVAFIEGIADKGMNLAMIENYSIFQKETPLQLTVNTNNRNSSSINQIDTNDNDLNELVELNKDQNQINDIYDEPSAEEDNNDIEKEENQAIEHLIESTNENYQILADFKSKQIYAGLSEYDILIYPILFWNGKGGCGKLENESKFYSSRLRYSVISMCMQSPDYYFNQCSALREEFICSVYGRLIQLRINYEFNRQKQLFMKKEISPNMIQKDLKYGIKTYIPSSFTGSAQYWKKVTNQGFYLTLILGPPKFFVTITFNPKWNEVTALNNNEALLINNSPLIARIFN